MFVIKEKFAEITQRIVDFLYDIESFVKNSWHFRRELAKFRVYDYSHNLAVFKKSLQLSSDFLASDKACTLNASLRAAEINKFIALLDAFEDPTPVVKRRLGYEPDYDTIFNDFLGDTKSGSRTLRAPEFSAADKAYYAEMHNVEDESWEAAWKLIAETGRRWWD